MRAGVDSNLIRAAGTFSLLGVASFIYWELKIRHPIMNLRACSSRLAASWCAPAPCS